MTRICSSLDKVKLIVSHQHSRSSFYRAHVVVDRRAASAMIDDGVVKPKTHHIPRRIARVGIPALKKTAKKSLSAFASIISEVAPPHPTPQHQPNLRNSFRATITMSFINEAVNRAVDLMKSGMNEDAATELAYAITRHFGEQEAHLGYRPVAASSSSCVGGGKEPPSLVNTTGAPDSTLALQLWPVPPHEQPTVKRVQLSAVTTGSNRTMEDPQPNHVVYEYAFLLPHNDDKLTTLYKRHTIVVLLYNMGLAYQRLGIQTGKDVSLYSAAIVYGMIFNVTGGHSVYLFPSLRYLHLGLCNNLTYLHLVLLQEGPMRAARDLLRDFLRQLPLDNMPQEQYAFFRLSLFCLEKEEFQYSPAA